MGGRYGRVVVLRRAVVGREGRARDLSRGGALGAPRSHERLKALVAAPRHLRITDLLAAEACGRACREIDRGLGLGRA